MLYAFTIGASLKCSVLVAPAAVGAGPVSRSGRFCDSASRLHLFNNLWKHRTYDTIVHWPSTHLAWTKANASCDFCLCGLWSWSWHAHLQASLLGGSLSFFLFLLLIYFFSRFLIDLLQQQPQHLNQLHTTTSDRRLCRCGWPCGYSGEPASPSDSESVHTFISLLSLTFASIVTIITLSQTTGCDLMLFWRSLMLWLACHRRVLLVPPHWVLCFRTKPPTLDTPTDNEYHRSLPAGARIWSPLLSTPHRPRP